MGADLSRQSGACSKPVVLVEEVSAGGGDEGGQQWETTPSLEVDTGRGQQHGSGLGVTSEQAPEGGLAVATESPRPAPAETVIIFDWDDTLLCSTSLNSTTVQLRQLEELQRAAESALHAAMNLGEVLIVTNGNGTWVQDSASRFMPRLLPMLSKLKVVSARALFEQMHPGDPFMWKRVAFTQLLTEDRTFPADPGLNLIALGDQLPEINAANHVVKLIGGSSMVKTVKFKEAPTVTEIIGQLSRVEQDLPKIVNAVSSHCYSMARRPLPLQWDNLAAYANGWKCTSDDEHPWSFSDIGTFKDMWHQFF